MKAPLIRGEGVYFVERRTKLETFQVGWAIFKAYHPNKPGYARIARCKSSKHFTVQTEHNYVVSTSKLFGDYQEAMREAKRLTLSSKAGHKVYKAEERQRVHRFMTEDDNGF